MNKDCVLWDRYPSLSPGAFVIRNLSVPIMAVNNLRPLCPKTKNGLLARQARLIGSLVSMISAESNVVGPLSILCVAMSINLNNSVVHYQKKATLPVESLGE